MGDNLKRAFERFLTSLLEEAVRRNSIRPAEAKSLECLLLALFVNLGNDCLERKR